MVQMLHYMFGQGVALQFVLFGTCSYFWNLHLQYDNKNIFHKNTFMFCANIDIFEEAHAWSNIVVITAQTIHEKQSDMCG